MQQKHETKDLAIICKGEKIMCHKAGVNIPILALAICCTTF